MKLIHNQIQYVEFLSRDLKRIAKFYSDAFGWVFTDYGPEYTAFAGEYVDGGFTLGDTVKGSVLVILYSEKIEETRDAVTKAGGVIAKDIYAFPGGKRFHFTDPDGNVLAVWTPK